MKRYKLLRWYPGIPFGMKHQKVCVEIVDDSDLVRLIIYPIGRAKSTVLVPRSEVENNPDYWELEKSLSVVVRATSSLRLMLWLTWMLI